MNTEDASATIFRLSSIDELQNQDFIEIGLLHAEIRKTVKDFGLGDCFVLSLARKIDGKILTGDPHFKGFKECVLI